MKMKGVIFTEFLELIDEKFSPDLAEEVIIESELESGGAYTAVGTYHHCEMIKMVGVLSEKTEIPATDLQKAFGEYLFGRFTKLYPQFFADTDDARSRLSQGGHA